MISTIPATNINRTAMISMFPICPFDAVYLIIIKSTLCREIEFAEFLPRKCYNIRVTSRKTLRLKMDEYNRERREKRRVNAPYSDDEFVLFKDAPSLQELKDALRDVSTGHLAIIRLAALMDNLSLCEGRRVTSTGGRDYRGQTSGIKAFLRQDGYLYSRYSCLMRYKKLGLLLRNRSGIPIEANLLWGLIPTCPTDEHDDLYCYEVEWQTLHDLYASFEGMNFKQINDKLRIRTQ